MWFRSSPITEVRIEQTNACGTPFELIKTLCRPRTDGIHCFIKKFSQLGIYYFSIDIKHHDKGKREQPPPYWLAIIVSPKINFHDKLLGKRDFNSRTVTIANTNDFIIWKFDKTICHNVVNSLTSDTFEDVVTCHDRAIIGKNRQYLAVEGNSPGAFFYSNPGKK